MGILDPLLQEAVKVLTAIQMHVVGYLGPLAPVITGAGQIIAASLSLFMLLWGRGFFAPPTDRLPGFAARLAGAIGGVGVVIMYFWTQRDPEADVIRLAAYLATGGLVAAVLYFLVRSGLTFRCQAQNDVTHTRGFWLVKNAKMRLAGQNTGDPLYDGAPKPSDVETYICGTHSKPNLVFSPWSRGVAQVFLLIAFLAFSVPITLAVSGASLALMQLQVAESDKEIRIDLPSDVLFGFDESDLRSGASAVLQRAVNVIKKRGARSVRLQGHTDAKGLPEHNARLSMKRAQAVETWLTTTGELRNVTFKSEGFGATQPVAPNFNADGSDNPNGRQLNRRVAIIIEK